MEKEKLIALWNAYASGDYETLLRELNPLAEEGNAVAQFALAIMYFKGYGTQKDSSMAMLWFASSMSSQKKAHLTEEKMTPEKIAEVKKLAHEIEAKKKEESAREFEVEKKEKDTGFRIGEDFSDAYNKPLTA